MIIEYLDSPIYTFTPEIKQLIDQILKSAEPEVRLLLPMLSKKLRYIISAAPEVIPDTGQSAQTLNQNTIKFIINPSHPLGMTEIINNRLRASFFHESHHAARQTKISWGGSIVDKAIFEGLAVIFERDNVKSMPPWGNYNPRLIAGWTKEFLAVADTAKINQQHWFFNHPDGRRWVGYKVGTYLVDRAIQKNPKRPAPI